MSKNKNVILYGVLSLIIIGAIYFIPMFLNDPFEKIKTEILQTNKTLPKMVDEETRLELVQFVDKKIETYYTLVKITKEEVDVEKIIPGVKESLKNSICGKQNFLDNLSKGVDYSFTYKDKNSELISTIIITKSDCK
ncbi:hypothetical protein [Arcobacter ellisii]|uniref:Uncharacterized protein n=1 Tax=Arcobacter ellisii TaxID=913109 RepID=A0A347U869_9BACT|nr:hypothetical protein [Arcobacter ellisii]AXX95047.1 hypothetical protein AELL_1384 [Arcobacter ellisii]RXI30368.1 hypothetical protein CP962_08455 [Arcobacter ellisii]